MKPLVAGQLRDGERGGLYLTIEPRVSVGFPCWYCLILEADSDFPADAVGSLEDIPAQWLRVYTKLVE